MKSYLSLWVVIGLACSFSIGIAYAEDEGKTLQMAPDHPESVVRPVIRGRVSDDGEHGDGQAHSGLAKQSPAIEPAEGPGGEPHRGSSVVRKLHDRTKMNRPEAER